MVSRQQLFTTMLLGGALIAVPVQAQQTGDPQRASKLEGRVRDLEARVAAVESELHAGMGMGMKHRHMMMPDQKKDGMRQPPPQGSAGSGTADHGMEMPPTDGQQQPMNGGQQGQGMSSGGGMGHM